MKIIATIIVLLGTCVPAVGIADIRELSQAELRTAVARRGAIATRRIIADVEDYTNGDVVEVRAFMQDRSVTYRVLVRQIDGKLGLVMVDGTTGHAVKNNSPIGRDVRSFAAASAATGTSAVISNGQSRNRSTKRGGNNRNR